MRFDWFDWLIMWLNNIKGSAALLNIITGAINQQRCDIGWIQQFYKRYVKKIPQIMIFFK